jgi:predicted Zn-dependent protease
MKKILLSLLMMLAFLGSYSQILFDDGPLLDPDSTNLRYSLFDSKWDKYDLTYYINNVSNHLTAELRHAIIQQAFQTWQNASKLTFTEVSSPSLADIKISWEVGDHGDGKSFGGGSVALAHAAPPPPEGGVHAGEVHFDDDRNWTNSSANFNLLTSAIHEIGHALGVGHSNVSGSIMWPSYTTAQTYLAPDDIQAINAIYNISLSGDPNLYLFQTGSYSIANVPSGTSIVWSIGSGGIIVSGQGTNSVTVSICSGTGAVLTATLSGQVNQAFHKLIFANPGDFSVTSLGSHFNATMSNPYATSFDWELGSGLISYTIGSGTINNSPYSSIHLEPTSIDLTGTAIVSVRAKTGSYYSDWQSVEVSLVRPEIDESISYLNPYGPEPFYAYVVEELGSAMYPVEYKWYFDDQYLTTTETGYVFSWDWPCGDHNLSVSAVIDGVETLRSQNAQFWGMCHSPSLSSSSSLLHAYPNPVDNELTVELNATDGSGLVTTKMTTETASKAVALSKEKDGFTVQLYSQDHTTLVYSKTEPAGTGQIRINTSKLKDGIYFLVISQGKEKTSSQTVIVKH